MSASTLERVPIADFARSAGDVDPVTGLPGPDAARDELVRRQHADGAKVAVAYLGVDWFDETTAGRSRDAGYAIVIELASRLRRVAGPSGFVARCRPAEFVTMTSVGNWADGPRYARGLRSSVSGSAIHIEGVAVPLDVSVGLAVARRGDDPDQILRSANAAMVEAQWSRGGLSVARP